MNAIHSAELSHSLSILPYYSNNILGTQPLLVVTCQLCICMIMSISLIYFTYHKFRTGQKDSWKKATSIILPIQKRLQNLEKERIIWNSYVEWIEEYCTVYYGLLNYVNSTISDLDKLYKNRSRTLKSVSDISDQTTEGPSSKAADSHGEGEFPSETSWDGVISDEEDIQLVANFARVFANLKLQGAEKSVEEEKPLTDLASSAVSTEAPSTLGTNEGSGRDTTAASEDELKNPEGFIGVGWKQAHNFTLTGGGTKAGKLNSS